MSVRVCVHACGCVWALSHVGGELWVWPYQPVCAACGEGPVRWGSVMVLWVVPWAVGPRAALSPYPWFLPEKCGKEQETESGP